MKSVTTSPPHGSQCNKGENDLIGGFDDVVDSGLASGSKDKEDKVGSH